MASVSGSKLSFFAPGLDASAVNIVLTPDGTGAVPVAGKFNIEVFTSTSATNLDAGFQAGAVLQGATLVTGTTNTVQVGALISIQEQLLAGTYTVVDETGNEDIQILGAGAAPFSQITVVGSAGDTITGSAIASNTQVIDASGANPLTKAGAMTVFGGAGNTTVVAGSNDKILGGLGKFEVNGNAGDNNSIVGGAGTLTAYNFGTGTTVTGGSETTFIDDGYGLGGGNNLLRGGTAALNFIKGAAGDTIVGGTGLSLVVDGSAGTQSITGGGGSSTYITGGVGDTIAAGAGASIIVDGTAGAMTITGGGIAALTGFPGQTFIFGGANDRITGSAGNLQVGGNAAAGETITAGTGNLFAFNLGTGNTVSGSTAGTTFIDDSYGGGGASSLTGGAGASTIIGGLGDTITAGSGALEARVKTGFGAETINLSASGSADGVRDVDVDTGSLLDLGTKATVTGFSTADDRIESATSFVGGVFLGTSVVVGSDTLVTFVDGSTMLIVGVTGPITFTA